MYAILDNNNICVAMTRSGKLHNNTIEVTSNVLGKKYVDGEWISVESPSAESTQLDRIEAATEYLMAMQE